jgi:DinB family protein
MHVSAQIAKHLRDVHFGGNWTASNLKQHVLDLTWQQATTKISSFNTIVALVYHMNYYVSTIIKVLQGGPLDASDKYSFDHPPISSQPDWENLLDKTWSDVETLAALIEQLPDAKLGENFLDGKYGTWYRNLAGVTEHTHYHLGQIVLIKKMLIMSKGA